MRRASAHAARAALCALTTILFACHPPVAVRTGGSDPLAARRTELSAQRDWSFEGRAALSNGKDAVTVRLEWQQHGSGYVLTLRAPVSGETWRLTSSSEGALLEGGGKPPRRGPDAEALLQRESGLRVPVSALVDWARGLSHDPARAETALDERGRPELIRESGWQIRIREYDEAVTPARPRSLEAEKAPYRVRLAIASWQLDS